MSNYDAIAIIGDLSGKAVMHVVVNQNSSVFLSKVL